MLVRSFSPENGARVGKNHRASIEWEAALPIQSSGREMTNIQTAVVRQPSGPSTAPKAAAD